MRNQDSDPVGQFTRISHLLRKVGHNPDDAIELTEIISNMASINIVSRLESKIDAQNSKYNLLIGLVTGGLTAFVALAVAIIGWLLNQ